MVDAVAVVCNQLETVSRFAQHSRIDAVSDRRYQDVGLFHHVSEFRGGERLVLEIKLRVEQFAHPGLDPVGQLARDDDKRLLFGVRHN